jgi:hypothetical protein
MLGLVYDYSMGLQKNQSYVLGDKQIFKQVKRPISPLTLVALTLALLVFVLSALVYARNQKAEWNSPNSVAEVFMQAVATGDPVHLAEIKLPHDRSIVPLIMDEAISGSNGGYTLLESAGKNEEYYFLYALSNTHNKYARVTVRSLAYRSPEPPFYVSSYVFSPESLSVIPNIKAVDASTPHGCVLPSETNRPQVGSQSRLGVVPYEIPQLYFLAKKLTFKQQSSDDLVTSDTTAERLVGLYDVKGLAEVARSIDGYRFGRGSPITYRISYTIVPHDGSGNQNSDINKARVKYLTQRLIQYGVPEEDITTKPMHYLFSEPDSDSYSILLRSTCPAG